MRRPRPKLLGRVVDEIPCPLCREPKPGVARWCYHCTKQVETILDCNHRVIRERLRLARLRVKWLEAALPDE